MHLSGNEERALLTIERRVIVGSPDARLSRFVTAAVWLAREYDSDITVGYGGREADAKRVLESLMVLGRAKQGEEVVFKAEGEDAKEALEALARLVEGK